MDTIGLAELQEQFLCMHTNTNIHTHTHTELLHPLFLFEVPPTCSVLLHTHGPQIGSVVGVNIKKIAVAIGACGALDHFVSFVSDAYIPYLQDAPICQGPLEKLQKHMKNVIYGLIAARL